MESEEKVHDMVWLEVWRQHRENLLEEAKNARLAREIRRGRKAASRGVADKPGGMDPAVAKDPGA